MPKLLRELILYARNPNGRFSERLRNFAIRASPHSRASYEFIRKALSNLLPCYDSIHRWMDEIGDMSPGEIEPAIEKVSEMVNTNNGLVFNMTLDEVAIKRFAKNN